MKLHINPSGWSPSFVVLTRTFFVTYLTRNTHHHHVSRYILCYFYAVISNKLKLCKFHQVSLFSDSNFPPTITISLSIITIFLMFPLDIISWCFVNFTLPRRYFQTSLRKTIVKSGKINHHLLNSLEFPDTIVRASSRMFSTIFGSEWIFTTFVITSIDKNSRKEFFW